MSEGIPIILLSGMAAEERLFGPQLKQFPNLRVQPWIDPLPGESLRAYAARLAPLADPGRPCIVGGASFGGVVALELAGHVSALACVLIGSIRSPSGLPRKWRLLQPLAHFGPDTLRLLATAGAYFGRWFMKGGTLRRLQRLSRPEASFVRWAMCAVVQWRPSPATARVPIYQIHGAADRELPVTLSRPDVVVPSGGHALSLFSPAAVNEFLAHVIHEVTPHACKDSTKTTRS